MCEEEGGRGEGRGEKGMEGFERGNQAKEERKWRPQFVFIYTLEEEWLSSFVFFSFFTVVKSKTKSGVNKRPLKEGGCY